MNWKIKLRVSDRQITPLVFALRVQMSAINGEIDGQALSQRLGDGRLAELSLRQQRALVRAFLLDQLIEESKQQNSNVIELPQREKTA